LSEMLCWSWLELLRLWLELLRLWLELLLIELRVEDWCLLLLWSWLELLLVELLLRSWVELLLIELVVIKLIVWIFGSSGCSFLMSSSMLSCSLLLCWG